MGIPDRIGQALHERPNTPQLQYSILYLSPSSADIGVPLRFSPNAVCAEVRKGRITRREREGPTNVLRGNAVGSLREGPVSPGGTRANR